MLLDNFLVESKEVKYSRCLRRLPNTATSTCSILSLSPPFSFRGNFCNSRFHLHAFDRKKQILTVFSKHANHSVILKLHGNGDIFHDLRGKKPLKFREILAIVIRKWYWVGFSWQTLK